MCTRGFHRHHLYCPRSSPPRLAWTTEQAVAGSYTQDVVRTQHWTYCVSDNLHVVDARVEDALRKNCLHAWSDLAQPDISAQS
jgi:hypothetical protein